MPARFARRTDGKVLVERIRQASAKVDYAHARASIVIPVYNNLVYTLTCIASILDDPTTVAFEIIVGDDRSTDDTSAVLRAIGGWRARRAPRSQSRLPKKTAT